MTRIRTTELARHVGARVTVEGWLQAIRTLKHVAFLILRDGYGTAQVVAEVPSQALRALEAAEATNESVVRVEATVRAMPKAPGGVELVAPELEVISAVREPTPVLLSKRELTASLPTLLDHAPTTLRHPQRRAAFRLSAEAMASFRATLSASGFTEVQTPKLVASATEGGANVFAIDYFGREAFLAQSPQFYKQTMVGVFERVFEVGPVFRAEPHATARHLNTYTSLDLEMGFIENHTTVMAQLREVLAAMIERIASRCEAALELLGAPKLPEVPAVIPSVHFKEALAMIEAETGEPVGRARDLAPHHERWLGAWAKRTWGSDFLFVTGYPMSKRPFYTHPEPGAPEWSNSFDLLFRGLELVTGGQRLHRYEAILAALAEVGLEPEPFASYLEIFRYGMPPHGGFGLGLERLIMQLIGASNLRMTALFPRDIHRLSP